MNPSMGVRRSSLERVVVHGGMPYEASSRFPERFEASLTRLVVLAIHMFLPATCIYFKHV